MERVIAQLRVAIVLLAGTVLLHPSLVHVAALRALWGTALAYAVATVLAAPYRRLPLLGWDVGSRGLDWSFITLWILATGGLRSDFHVLYFLSILSTAMRFGLREVMLAAAGTVIGYFGVAFVAGPATPLEWQEAGVRMGFVVLFALGSGVLAREAHRHFRARLQEQAQRVAIQDVTATVAHDLSNPLAAVSGLVEIVLESAAATLSFDQRALLHRIDANTQQMRNLISNLLDAELIDRGQQSFRPLPLDLNTLVRRVVEAQVHQAEVKGIGLVLDLGPRLPLALLDERMLERLIANLLSNAVKFTPEQGAIRVSTRRHGSRVAIEVWDSGPPVPATLKSMLFDKFVRQKDSPGTGLGLYICKSIVAAHHGEISVRESGSGVAFIAELPIALVGQPQRHAPGLSAGTMGALATRA
jgi:signal transduction histidine kinase